MAIRYQVIQVTSFEQNCTLLWCEETMRGAVVDPGGNIPRILDAVKAHGVVLEKILVTHGHIDHAGAVADLAAQLSLPIEGPQRDDQFLIDGMPEQSKMYGFPNARSFTPDRWLVEGDTVEIDIPARRIHLAVTPEILAARRAAMEAKGDAAWKPVDRQRVVSAALQAYALMATSADKGAVRDVTQIQRRK